MCKTQSSFKLFAGALALAAVVTLPTAARAAAVTLNVDSSLSSLTLSGNAFTLNYGSQALGSLVTSWGGTISGDLTAGILTFSGGSAITAILNPTGPYTTAPNPIGSEQGNYGVKAVGFVTGYGLTTINGVYRDLVLDITSGTAQNGLAPAGNNLSFTAGALDYGVGNPTPLTAGTSSLVGVTGPGTSSSLVSFDGTTLILPVTFHTTGSNRYEDWSGTIVATVAVPEPSALALLGVGLMGLVGVQFRRSRRSV